MKTKIRVTEYRVYVTTETKTDIGVVIENSSITKDASESGNCHIYTYHCADYSQSYFTVTNLALQRFGRINQRSFEKLIDAISSLKSR